MKRMHSSIEKHREALASLCRQVGVRRLHAFGSAVRADFHSQSDVDFIVEFEPAPPAQYADAFFTLKSALESLFSRPVDLLTEGSVDNPYLRHRIDAERVKLYER